MKPTISVVAPVYNEEEVLSELVRRVRAVMEETGETWELVLVNDGSHDRSAQIIAELHEADSRVTGVSFSHRQTLIFQRFV